MNLPWVICLSRDSASALADIRLVAGVEVAEAGSLLWLRGRSADESLNNRILALPAIARFEVSNSGQWRQTGHRIPTPEQSSLKWQLLVTWFRVEFPLAALAALPPPPVSLQLIRSTEESEPSLLLTSLTAFYDLVKSMGVVRLRRWVFAVEANGQVLVWGSPLPSLPGSRFVLQEGVAVSAGWRWVPTVSSSCVARLLGASSSSLIVWHENGSLHRLHRDQFVPVTRSGVAQTLQMKISPHEF